MFTTAPFMGGVSELGPPWAHFGVWAPENITSTNASLGQSEMEEFLSQLCIFFNFPPISKIYPSPCKKKL